MDSDDLGISDQRDAMEEEEEESRPTELYTVDGSDEFTVFSPDRLSVKYTRPDYGGGIIQADYPAPTKCLAYYFEVYIVSAGENGEIAVGFSKEHINDEGYKVKSVGYIGHSGVIYHDQTVVKNCDSYTTGDTVGCGIDGVSHDFFFTKNGTIVGTIPREFKHPLYPTIVFRSRNEDIRVNFGRTPFSFDFSTFEESLRDKKNMEMEKIAISRSISHELVRTYLHHYAYEGTFKAFNLAASAQEGAVDEYELHQRKNLREMIMTADIDAAIAELRDRYPQLIEDGSEVHFHLVCQKIVELVRTGARAEAKAYGDRELKDFRDSELLKDLLDHCSALLNCETVEESGVAYLLEERQKQRVADAVNEAILSTDPDNDHQLPSLLERVLRQVEATSSLYHRDRQ